MLYRLTTVTPPDVLPFVSTLTFELGDTQDCVSIPVVDDDLLEDTESFSVSIFSLSSPSAVVANRSFANVLIADNESKNQASFRHQKQLQIIIHVTTTYCSTQYLSSFYDDACFIYNSSY